MSWRAALLAGVSLVGLAMPARPSLRLLTTARTDHYPSAVVLDPAVHTAYVVNNGTNDLTLIDLRACNARVMSGCSARPPRQDVGLIPTAAVLDPSTGTLYVANYSENGHGTVSAVATARCRATHASGCTHYPRIAPELGLPFSAGDIAVDSPRHTVYVVGGGRTLAVIDSRRCSARAPACRGALGVARVRTAANAVAVDSGTGSAYVLGYGTSTLSVIDVRSCRAGRTTGCGRPRAVVRLRRHPWRVVVASDHGVYITGLGSRAVEVLDGRTCNAATTQGCARPLSLVHVGLEPEGLAIDRPAGIGVVTNAGDGTLSVFELAHCRAADMTGCGDRPTRVRVGGLPDGIAADPATGTVYVTDNAGTGRALRVLGTG